MVIDARWLPWCWTAAALACAGLLALVQPWRREFRIGFGIADGWLAGAWLIPGVLLGADFAVRVLRQGNWPEGEELAVSVGRGTAESLMGAIHGFGFGEGAALLAGLALAVNLGGLRRGLRKGLESVSHRPPARMIAVLLIGIAGAAAAPVLDWWKVAMVWKVLVSLLVAPLAGWTSSLLLAGLLLLAETGMRAPRKLEQVRWMETAAAHSARLWPWTVAQALIFLGRRWIPDDLPIWAGWLPVGTGAVLVFAPVVFLHVKKVSGSGAGVEQSLRLWGAKGWQPVAWAGVAGVWFFLWRVAGLGLASEFVNDRVWLRITLASLHGLAHTWLTVGMLGAWTALRLRDLPPPAPRPRSLRRPHHSDS